jgi:hypothetical protein
MLVFRNEYLTRELMGTNPTIYKYFLLTIVLNSLEEKVCSVMQEEYYMSI